MAVGDPLLWGQSVGEALRGLFAAMFGVGIHVRAHTSNSSIVSTTNNITVTCVREESVVDALLHSLGSIKALEADLAQVLDAVGLVGLELRLVLVSSLLFSIASTLLGGLHEESVRFRSRCCSECSSGITFAPCRLNTC